MRLDLLTKGISVLLSVFLAACVSSDRSSVSHPSIALAKDANWTEQVIATGSESQFQILSYRNSIQPTDGVLTVYIEGDGRAWYADQPSDDPTPLRAISLELSLRQPSGAVAYLARPCQFVGVGTNALCRPILWTDQRYSEAVILSLGNAIDVMKRVVGAQKVILIGYSGGGTLSLLLAARRIDVVGIVTVAGNLDIDAWTSYHHLRPLQGSLNPAKAVEKIQAIPQVNFVGGLDEIIPLAITKDVLSKYPVQSKPKLITIQDNAHVCCWVEQWPDLWVQIPQMR